MTTPPRVTVIVATYNGAETLRSTLASLCAQDFEDFEAWVVGDACTDGSEAVVSATQDPRVHWTNLPRNGGSQSAGNNEGLRRARGRYVAYLGHDDLWFPWHLTTLVAVLENSGADIAHSLTALVNPAGIAGVFGEPPGGVSYAHQFVPPSSWLHRRDIVEQIGWWAAPHEASCGVDFDYARRMLAAGRRITFADRLSVLKFPSQWFRAYAPDGVRPQADYLARMQADPNAFEMRTLTSLACLLAQDQAPSGAQPRSPAAYAWQAARVLLRRHAVDRLASTWPVSRLEHWRFQYLRRRARARRGLPPG